jgi:SPP1 gp7 family putative phage head morphogenesis protein
MQPSDLDADLLQQTLNDLRSGLSEGVGKSFLNYEDNAVRNVSLNQHLYRFSGAKTYQQIALLNFYLKDKPSFADFKKEALKINDQYNKRYLETEFNTAKRSGEQATKWLKYQDQKELYPNLQYKTANDSRVREQHKNQQDIIKPIDDAFWLTWYPPNDFGCRCYVVQTDEKATDGTPKENPSPGFNNNVGISNMVFAEDEHPYFVFPASDVVKIKSSFESLKQSNPDYQLAFKTKKAKLEVSTWADKDDLTDNIEAAKIIVSQLAFDMKIREHVNIKNISNPEYLVNNKLADLKTPESGNYKNVLRKAKEQSCTTVIISTKINKDTLEHVRSKVRNILKQKGVHNIIENFVIIV